MRIVASLDAWLALRDFAGDDRSDLVAAASLAEVAGVDALRLSIQDEGGPVRESDVDALRRAARFFELCMPVSQTLLKVPLEARPDRVVLVGDRKETAGSAPPVDARAAGSGLGAVVRALEEAGLRTSVRVAPQIEAVRAIHALGVRDVELFTGHLVDLPEEERRGALVALGDTARLAAKLRLGLAVAGGLDEWNLREVLEAAPSVERVVLGRGLARRSLLVGVDRATRDLRERMS
ncbi:MAG: pyridoxine 5'-phosphate synthase [Deltaproteobacteria bacterium]|jgi:pyridoxine 5-phosphate synthase|nr:pyridoxine 5'-phosphate synthase [Deltaproteobacteria bacterium]MBW2497891.1 pyridoxine 5'-phosphate synthase [Deltaproteobacteria bacterium]